MFHSRNRPLRNPEISPGCSNLRLSEGSAHVPWSVQSAVAQPGVHWGAQGRLGSQDFPGNVRPDQKPGDVMVLPSSPDRHQVASIEGTTPYAPRSTVCSLSTIGSGADGWILRLPNIHGVGDPFQDHLNSFWRPVPFRGGPSLLLGLRESLPSYRFRPERPTCRAHMRGTGGHVLGLLAFLMITSLVFLLGPSLG